MQRDESPVPHFAAADLHLIQRTVDHVRRRLRIQAAVRGLSHGLVAAATVMQMEYRDCVINLLDTPGHQDFSEDTYRVLTAVDAALMVIDAATWP